MAVKMTVKRKEVLAKKLYGLAPAAKKANLDAALKGAQDVLATAKQLAPVKSGKLRASGRARLLVDEKDTVSAIAGFSASHAHLVEFGTAQREQKSTRRATGSARKQPFLFPAYRMKLKSVKSRFARALNKSAKEVASKK